MWRSIFRPCSRSGPRCFTAVITVFGTIWVARARTKVDIGTTITSGFRELTDQLQEERNHLSDLIRRQRDELAAVEKVIGDHERTMRRMRRHVGRAGGPDGEGGARYADESGMGISLAGAIVAAAVGRMMMVRLLPAVGDLLPCRRRQCWRPLPPEQCDRHCLLHTLATLRR